MAQLVERRVRNAKATGSNPVISTIQEQRCDTTVLNLFSLHKGFISLSVNEHQSLMRCLTALLQGSFSLQQTTTERKVYLRNDRYCYGTIGFSLYGR